MYTIARLTITYEYAKDLFVHAHNSLQMVTSIKDKQSNAFFLGFFALCITNSFSVLSMFVFIIMKKKWNNN